VAAENKLSDTPAKSLNIDESGLQINKNMALS